jgi:hypothetical protein
MVEPLAKPPNLSVFLDLVCPKKVTASKLYPMESSAKTQHFQLLQAHGYGLALDSMGHNEADHDKMPKSVQKS